jgi:hypothetical protein
MTGGSAAMTAPSLCPCGSGLSAAHLAGALAAPIFVLLPFAPDWRWLRRRGDSPWYPTMRLFRQPALGQRAPAIAEAAEAAARRLAR